MCLESKSGGKVSVMINAASQVYKQTIQFVYLGGAITVDKDISIEITRRLQRAWACFQWYKMEIYDRLGVRLLLKVRLLKTEVSSANRLPISIPHMSSFNILSSECKYR